MVYKLVTEGPSVGWRETWRKAFESFDFAGEGHACEELGLSTGCLEDFSAVKRRYRELALEYHPDKQAGASEEERKASEARFVRVQEAYEHLQKIRSDAKKKEEEGDAGGGGGGASSAAHEEALRRARERAHASRKAKRAPGAASARRGAGSRGDDGEWV